MTLQLTLAVDDVQHPELLKHRCNRMPAQVDRPCFSRTADIAMSGRTTPTCYTCWPNQGFGQYKFARRQTATVATGISDSSFHPAQSAVWSEHVAWASRKISARRAGSKHVQQPRGCSRH